MKGGTSFSRKVIVWLKFSFVNVVKDIATSGTGEDFSNAEAYKSIIREQDKQIVSCLKFF
jgi:hypothetical protein